MKIFLITMLLFIFISCFILKVKLSEIEQKIDKK